MQIKIKIQYIFLIAVIILFTPHLIRDNGILIGEKSYYHARIAKDIIENKFYDDLSYQGRNYFINPYQFILAIFSYIFGVEFSSKLLPFLLGILSLLCFYSIIKKYFKEENILILFILILSPAFIYTFTISDSYSFFIFLSLLGFNLFLKNNKKYFIISLVLFAIIPFFGLFEVFLIALLLLFYYLYKKDNKILIILLIIAIIASIYYINIAYFNPNTEMPNFLEKNIIKDSIIELGALIGFGIFNLLLILIGIILSWKYKRKIYLIYLIILILIISYYYIGKTSNIYLNFIFAVFAGLALYRLINLKWEVKLIRNLTLIILTIGLLFSCVNYIIILSNSLPNKDIIDSLEYLIDLKGDNVLSSYKNGYWIEYYGKKTVMDSNFYYAPDLNQRFKDINFIFMSYDLEKTKEMLNKYNIDYIYITPEMENKGLLFLFKNKETFKNLYNWNDIGIWQVK